MLVIAKWQVLGPPSTSALTAIRRSGILGASASGQEQQEYLKLFGDYEVFVYGARLSSFNGETFKVRGNRTDDSETIFSADTISPKGEPPIKVDWRFINDHGSPRSTT